MIIPVFPFYAEQVGVHPSSVIFFLGLYSLGQLVGAPIWGAMSDRIGRRPVLLITLLANAAGNISAAYAYTTDITTDETRPKALGLLGSALGRVAHGAAIMSLIAFVLTAVRLPESLPPEKRSRRSRSSRARSHCGPPSGSRSVRECWDGSTDSPA